MNKLIEWLKTPKYVVLKVIGGIIGGVITFLGLVKAYVEVRNDWPATLFLFALLGFLCLLIGSAYVIFTRDKTTKLWKYHKKLRLLVVLLVVVSLVLSIRAVSTIEPIQRLVAEALHGSSTPTLTPTLASTSIPPPTSTPISVLCLISRLSAGKKGKVVAGDAIRILSDSSGQGKFVGSLPNGEEFIVLDGPYCVPTDGTAWWKIDYNGIEGWVIEGEQEKYFLEPVPLTHTLEIVLEANKTEVVPGETFEFTAIVTNTGSDILKKVDMFTFGNNFEYVKGSTIVEKTDIRIPAIDDWITTGTNVGTLAPNQRAYLMFSAKVPATATLGSQISGSIEAYADGVDPIATKFSLKVVPQNQRAIFHDKGVLQVANITEGTTGYQTEVNGDPGNVFDFNVTITNEGQYDARNVQIKVNLPKQNEPSTILSPSIIIVADNADSISDNVTIHLSKSTFLEPYVSLPSKKFGNTGLYDCTPPPPAQDPQGGCSIDLAFYDWFENLGTVHPGQTIQVLFLADAVNYQ